MANNDYIPKAPAPQPAAGQYYLSGLGPTYLDPKFADRLGNFMADLRTQNIEPQFVSGYCDTTKQASLPKDPTATTPAKLSLHSTGQAVDIYLKGLDEPTRMAILSAPSRAGLGWGGNFRAPDPNHFYFDPGGDRQQRIDNFSTAVRSLQDQIPDR